MKAVAQAREIDVTITMTSSQWIALRDLCEYSWDKKHLSNQQRDVCLELISFKDLV
ncbi:hypothetical protein SEA_WEASELS2_9 [Rhodococcus phage Weasels2]|uniref:Uncharacterized protein n=1 Tax=Rhodococcus phage Weasels2 TaxID=1897437 RepID=A0A1I9S9Z3_9CAUD|nr:hypothetical protein FDH04_gp009 [Rhodococcus phage Weasels2]AOZ63599.1 hypothetical protein SEA_WEASELS2_9 [Rhodococcus phage Weasels2]